MGSALKLRGDYSAGELRRLARMSKDVRQSSQLLSIAAVLDCAVDGVVRWRRVDLKRVIRDRFGVDYDPRYVGKLLHRLGFSHISARTQHPAQDAHIVEEFKKTGRAR